MIFMALDVGSTYSMWSVGPLRKLLVKSLETSKKEQLGTFTYKVLEIARSHLQSVFNPEYSPMTWKLVVDVLRKTAEWALPLSRHYRDSMYIYIYMYIYICIEIYIICTSSSTIILCIYTVYNVYIYIYTRAMANGIWSIIHLQNGNPLNPFENRLTIPMPQTKR